MPCNRITGIPSKLGSPRVRIHRQRCAAGFPGPVDHFGGRGAGASNVIGRRQRRRIDRPTNTEWRAADCSGRSIGGKDQAACQLHSPGQPSRVGTEPSRYGPLENGQIPCSLVVRDRAVRSTKSRSAARSPYICVLHDRFVNIFSFSVYRLYDNLVFRRLRVDQETDRGCSEPPAPRRQFRFGFGRTTTARKLLRRALKYPGPRTRLLRRH